MGSGGGVWTAPRAANVGILRASQILNAPLVMAVVAGGWRVG